MQLSRLTRGHPAGWPLAAALVLVAGYADLWRGGTTLSASLLLLGYLVLMPLAIRGRA